MWKTFFALKKYIQYSLVIMWEHCKHVSDDGVLHFYVNYVKRKMNRENSRDWCKKNAIIYILIGKMIFKKLWFYSDNKLV